MAQNLLAPKGSLLSYKLENLFLFCESLERSYMSIRKAILLSALSLCAIALFLVIKAPDTTQKEAVINKTPSAESNLPNNSDTSAAAQKINQIANKQEFLAQNTDANAAYKNLLQLEFYLSSLSSEEATALILDYLNSGEDASTALDFMLQPGGYLSTAPTLRTFLLDQLAQLDIEAAGQYAKNILDTSASADEWALALRNLVWANSGHNFSEDPYFAEKLETLLNNQKWLQHPTVGYLESFDAVVYHGGPQFTRKLAQLHNSQQTDSIQFASALALDRMAQQSPAKTLEILVSEPELLKNAPSTRAQIIARADVQDPAQTDIIQTYLFDTDLSEGELQVFAQNFPNFNQIISYNLITKQQTHNLNEHAQQDLATLKQIQSWLKDPRLSEPRYAKVKYALEVMQERSQEIRASIERGHEQNIERIQQTPI